MYKQGPYLLRTAPVVEGATKDYRDFADLLEKVNEILEEGLYRRAEVVVVGGIDRPAYEEEFNVLSDAAFLDSLCLGPDRFRDGFRELLRVACP